MDVYLMHNMHLVNMLQEPGAIEATEAAEATEATEAAQETEATRTVEATEATRSHQEPPAARTPQKKMRKKKAFLLQVGPLFPLCFIFGWGDSRREATRTNQTDRKHWVSGLIIHLLPWPKQILPRGLGEVQSHFMDGRFHILHTR